MRDIALAPLGGVAMQAPVYLLDTRRPEVVVLAVVLSQIPFTIFFATLAAPVAETFTGLVSLTALAFLAPRSQHDHNVEYDDRPAVPVPRPAG